MIPDLLPSEIERFESKLRITRHGLIWSGSNVRRDGTAYFVIFRGGKRHQVMVHRLAYKVVTGTDPGDLTVRQRCGIRLCCTPPCLVAGPDTDAARVTMRRGRRNVDGLQAHRDQRSASVRDRLAAGKKQCANCKAVKPLDDFSRDAFSPDGYRYWCKGCRAGDARALRHFKDPGHPMTSHCLTRAERARFRSYLQPAGDCLVWAGPCGSNGRGAFFVTRDGKTILLPAHRVACILDRGFDPQGRGWLPSCRNMLCCAPDHILGRRIAREAA